MKHDLVDASTRHHHVRLLKYYRDNRARLVSSNRESFAHYKQISYFFNKYSLSLYVYTRGLLGCLLGFWPLGQNPAGVIIIYLVLNCPTELLVDPQVQNVIKMQF